MNGCLWTMSLATRLHWLLVLVVRHPDAFWKYCSIFLQNPDILYHVQKAELGRFNYVVENMKWSISDATTTSILRSGIDPFGFLNCCSEKDSIGCSSFRNRKKKPQINVIIYLLKYIYIFPWYTSNDKCWSVRWIWFVLIDSTNLDILPLNS